jgi:hypothetical protein
LFLFAPDFLSDCGFAARYYTAGVIRNDTIMLRRSNAGDWR